MPDVRLDAYLDAALDTPFDSPIHAASDAPTPDAPAVGAADATSPGHCWTGSPTVLVANLYLARQIAVDDANVYFTALSTTSSDEAIYQVPKNAAGSTPIELSSNDRQPLSLASDGTYVYWNDTLDPQVIRRVAVGGNGATTLAAIGTGGMALSPTSLFWVGASGVESMPKAGGTVTTLGPAPMGGGYGVAIDASYFYFAASSTLSATIFRTPLSGGATTTLAMLGTIVNVLATDGANVYFVSGDYLSSVPAAGGAVSVLASGFSGTTSLKLDSGNLYASISLGNGPYGSILRVPVTGGRPTALASAQWGVSDLAVDATSICWTNFGGPTGTGAVMVASKGGDDLTRCEAGNGQSGGGEAGVPEAGIDSQDADSACAPSQGLCGGVCIDGSSSAACTLPWTYVANVNAGAIAVDMDNVYWTESSYPGGSVMKLPKSGGAAVTVRSTTASIPSGLAVDSTNIYWGEFGSGPDGGSIDSLPLAADGGTPPNWLAGGGAQVLALSGSTLCFGAQVVGCLPVTGGPVTILNPVQGGQVLSMAVDSTNVYWTLFSSNGAVFSAPIGGGPVQLLVAHTDRPMGIAVDSTNVYWVGDGTGTVNAMSIAGGPVTTLATGPGYAEFLTLDSEYLFWSAGLDTNNGAILKMPVTGGTPTVLAWDVYGPGPLVVDAQFVYFILQNGAIAKALR